VVVVSIVRIGLAETKHFSEGYAAIFGKKKGDQQKPAKHDAKAKKKSKKPAKAGKKKSKK
jgi:hypothetical protein